MESDIEELFRRFIARADRDAIATEAEKVLKEKAPYGGGIFVFADYPGGLIGFTLRKLLFDGDDCCDPTDIDELVDRLFDYYGFAQNWIPPRLIVREVLALTVHRRWIIKQLQQDLGKSLDLAIVFERAAANIRCAKDAFLFGDDRTDALLTELRQMK